MGSVTPISFIDLPTEIIQRIFHCTSPNDLTQLQRVCRAFRDNVYGMPHTSYLRSATYLCATPIALLQQIVLIPQLAKLKIIGQVSQDLLSTISASQAASTLSSLHLANTTVDTATAIAIGNLPALRRLTLQNGTVTDRRCFSHFTKITHLSIRTTFKGISASMIALCNNLTHLRTPHEVDEQFIETIEPLKHLQSLTLSNSDVYGSMEPPEWIAKWIRSGTDDDHMVFLGLQNDGSDNDFLSVLCGWYSNPGRALMLKDHLKALLTRLVQSPKLSTRQKELLFKNFVYIGDTCLVTAAIQAGVNINARVFFNDTTALNFVLTRIREHHETEKAIEMLHLLLAQKADPNIPDKNSSLVLFEAISSHNSNLVHALLHAPIPANPLLHIPRHAVDQLLAIQTGVIESQPGFVFHTGLHSYSPLLFAYRLYMDYCADNDQLHSVISQLVKAGANLNLADDAGYTLLHYLAYTKRRLPTRNEIKFLIDAGMNVHAKSKDDATPFDILVQSMFEAKDRGMAYTPFWIEKYSLMELLVQSKAALDPRKARLGPQKFRLAPPRDTLSRLIAFATKVGCERYTTTVSKHIGGVTIAYYLQLLEMKDRKRFKREVTKDNVNKIFDSQRYSLLHHAALAHDEEIVSFLLSIGANPKARGYNNIEARYLVNREMPEFAKSYPGYI